MAVAATGGGVMEATFSDVLAEDSIGMSALEIARLCRNAMWTVPVPKFKDTVRVCRWLQALLDTGMAPPPRLPGMSGAGDVGASLAAALKIAKEQGTS